MMKYDPPKTKVFDVCTEYNFLDSWGAMCKECKEIDCPNKE